MYEQIESLSVTAKYTASPVEPPVEPLLRLINGFFILSDEISYPKKDLLLARINGSILPGAYIQKHIASQRQDITEQAHHLERRLIVIVRWAVSP